MDAARYARAKELFEAALPLGAAERRELLARTCQGDTGLGREVAELLRHHEEAPGFLSAGVRADTEEGIAEELPPKLRVSGYSIGRELGRGGMGVVYQAEQEQPRRAVALKFLRLDSLTAADVARFRREAEILGRLSHPGIAQIHAAGLAESEQGPLPWLAMELVRGETIRQYVTGRALGLRDVVALFAELCDAVEHAHEKGIVHRDLKPSNVLVDERGHVRVLDFGVARLVADEAPGGAPRTRTGQMVGTLAYASPEQATGKAGAVNARSDVYALGVILHELLTGELPYAIDESKIVEALQAICDEEPRRLRRLRRDAPADLERVLLKALAKEPARRYASAGALAADLRRFLAERPVTAKPATALYQARKFVRRNRALTVSTATVILALLVTVGVLLVARRNEREQFEHTRSMLDLMAREVFRLVPELGFGVDHRGTLEALDARLAKELALAPSDPALRGYRARSLYELGGLDLTAGDLGGARRRFDGACALRAGLVEQDPTDLESRTHLSQVYARLGEVARQQRDFAGEEAWFRRAFELDQALVQERPDDGELLEDLGWSLERMTDLAQRAGDWVEARRLAHWRLADATRLAEQEPDNWKFLYNAAQAHVLAWSVAERLAPHEVAAHRQALLGLARRLHDLQPRRAAFQLLWATANHNQAKQAWDAGRLQEALAHAEVAYGMAVQLLAGDSRSYAHVDFLRFVAGTLFGLQVEQGLRDQAEASLLRLRVCAGLAGEGSSNALLLLATADQHSIALQTTPESIREAEERALRGYMALLLQPETSVDMFERVAVLLRADWADIGPELCRRLVARDERVGWKMAALLGLEPVPSPAITADNPGDER